MLKSCYVVITQWNGGCVFSHAFSDFKKLENVIYDENLFFGNNILKKINLLCNYIGKFFYKIGGIIKSNSYTFANIFFSIACLLRVWQYRLIIKKKFKNKSQIVFVIFDGSIEFERGNICKYLKKHFRNCKIVYFLTDLLYKMTCRKELLDNRSRGYIDLIYSYDNHDSNRYCFINHNVPYSNLSKFVKSDSKSYKYDVCFIGDAKKRFEKIKEVYSALTDKGLKCGFFVADLNSIYSDSDIFLLRKFMKYEECLKIINESKCILEIIQEGSVGNTLRVYEAIMFNKLLLTDNQNINKSKFYDSRYMKIFKGLDFEDILSFINIKNIEYSNKQNLLPIRFLEDIDSRL